MAGNRRDYGSKGQHGSGLECHPTSVRSRVTQPKEEEGREWNKHVSEIHGKKGSEISKAKQRHTLELKQEVANTLKVSMGHKFRVKSHERQAL